MKGGKYEFKSALHRAHARDMVEREEERQIKKGRSGFTEEEYNARLAYYLSRIPYKLLKMRYSSFTRYFVYLKRLRFQESVLTTWLNCLIIGKLFGGFVIL